MTDIPQAHYEVGDMGLKKLHYIRKLLVTAIKYIWSLGLRGLIESLLRKDEMKLFTRVYRSYRGDLKRITGTLPTN